MRCVHAIRTGRVREEPGAPVTTIRLPVTFIIGAAMLQISPTIATRPPRGPAGLAAIAPDLRQLAWPLAG